MKYDRAAGEVSLLVDRASVDNRLLGLEAQQTSYGDDGKPLVLRAFLGATRSRPTLSGGESPPHHQP
jgi:hypothetical protein